MPAFRLRYQCEASGNSSLGFSTIRVYGQLVWECRTISQLSFVGDEVEARLRSNHELTASVVKSPENAHEVVV